jgi:GMP synthase (glutamine-hydrolysing)
MTALVLDCGSRKVPDIERCAVQAGFAVSTRPFFEDEEATADALIISGSPILLTETDPAPYVAHLARLLRSDLPVLAICFGHQLLGLAHGATVFRCAESRDWQPIALAGGSVLWEGLSGPAEMMEDHCEAISLPPGWQLLAESSTGLEAMSHASNPWFGVQFHPEVSEANGQRVFDNFYRIAGLYRG